MFFVSTPKGVLIFFFFICLQLHRSYRQKRRWWNSKGYPQRNWLFRRHWLIVQWIIRGSKLGLRWWHFKNVQERWYTKLDLYCSLSCICIWPQFFSLQAVQVEPSLFTVFVHCAVLRSFHADRIIFICYFVWTFHSDIMTCWLDNVSKSVCAFSILQGYFTYFHKITNFQRKFLWSEFFFLPLKFSVFTWICNMTLIICSPW